MGVGVCAFVCVCVSVCLCAWTGMTLCQHHLKASSCFLSLEPSRNANPHDTAKRQVASEQLKSQDGESLDPITRDNAFSKFRTNLADFLYPLYSVDCELWRPEAVVGMNRANNKNSQRRQHQRDDVTIEIYDSKGISKALRREVFDFMR